MFKKLGHIALASLLLISTIGMAVSKHYCGGELVSVSLYEGEEGNSCCDMGGCCENETQVYQVKENFAIPAISTVPFLAEIEILGHDLFAGAILIFQESEILSPAFDESPPLIPIQKALALRQVFLL